MATGYGINIQYVPVPGRFFRAVQLGLMGEPATTPLNITCCEEYAVLWACQPLGIKVATLFKGKVPPWVACSIYGYLAT